MEMIIEIFTETWRVIQEAAPYILLGFIVAGVLKAFLSDAFVARHLGKGRFSGPLKAAVFGAPIPL